MVAGDDWWDGQAYARLLTGDRRCFAWEWLRRTPAYIDAYGTDSMAASAFGLLRYEDPSLDALSARPFWCAGMDRAVLHAEALTAQSPDMFDLACLSRFATLLADRGEHVLLSDGLHSVRLDMISGSLATGPVALRWRIDGIADTGRQILALRQFLALARSGRFSRSLYPAERRAGRWVRMLRVHDALASGAIHREIAGVLFGADAAGPRWRVTANSCRLQVQRLASGARRSITAGPAAWLGHDG
ncbi:DUF2285 domain-containing protein [Sphingomonas sp.]|uniref:DNA -binding domain-containing protein n=1 Tax=Sphingomonas sp. TaxID=28214 RepID=UPI000DB1C9D7|nr:DUF2285 domain-containing protein [Sphingomonas sp.]PZU06714.1 MAG: hypothetical protein DI605_17945 [Sphingomonas sp.]